jgi:hypothetical protein
VSVAPPSEFAVGDEVWCLAWLGKPFVVVEIDEAAGRISIGAPSATDPYGAQVDLFPDTRWMLTREPWDQIWYWPDRAGETYETVTDRFITGLTVGQVLIGYYFDTGMGAIRQGMHVAAVPQAAMHFRVQKLDFGGRGRQVWVETVTPVDTDGRVLGTDRADAASGWERAGPAVPLRVGMSGYRWSLSFGEFILNWQDFLPA